MKTTMKMMAVAMMLMATACDTTEKSDMTEQEVCVAFEQAVTPAILECEGSTSGEREIVCRCEEELADADAPQLAADCAAESKFTLVGEGCVNTPPEGGTLPAACLELFDAVPCIKK